MAEVKDLARNEFVGYISGAASSGARDGAGTESAGLRLLVLWLQIQTRFRRAPCIIRYGETEMSLLNAVNSKAIVLFLRIKKSYLFMYPDLQTKRRDGRNDKKSRR